MIESLLNSISMMNINIQIHDSRIDLEKLNDTENNVIYIAKTTSKCFFSMMKASHPINSYICLAWNNQVSGINTTPCRHLAIFVKSFKPWAIKSLIDFEHLAQFDIMTISGSIDLGISIIILDYFLSFRWNPSLQILDILRMMEAAHLFWSCAFTKIHVELWSKAIVAD